MLKKHFPYEIEREVNANLKDPARLVQLLDAIEAINDSKKSDCKLKRDSTYAKNGAIPKIRYEQSNIYANDRKSGRLANKIVQYDSTKVFNDRSRNCKRGVRAEKRYPHGRSNSRQRPTNKRRYKKTSNYKHDSDGRATYKAIQYATRPRSKKRTRVIITEVTSDDDDKASSKHNNHRDKTNVKNEKSRSE